MNLTRYILISLIILTITGCSSDFERNQLIEGTYYPNGTIQLEGRPIGSVDNNFYLSVSGPLHITEIGQLKIHDFWNKQTKRDYEYVDNHFTGVLTYKAARAQVPGVGEYYIPIDLLNQTGRLEYNERSPSFTEWIQDNQILSIFIGLAILIGIIIWISHQINKRNLLEQEAERLRLLKLKEEQEAKEFTLKLNSLLSKSNEIVNQILPYFESSTMKSIDRAKFEFTENAYSPFWSEIEQASNYLAYYKEALTQLCINSELYNNIILENKKYKFSLPFPFPFATNISISKSVLEEYSQTIRNAQKEPTFSIIWEQRRNSRILASGFSTLENAINSMSSQLYSAINDLNNSISSRLDSIKYIQKEQLETFESSSNYLKSTLNSMDTKLYYIQWKEKPLGTFFPR